MANDTDYEYENLEQMDGGPDILGDLDDSAPPDIIDTDAQDVIPPESGWDALNDVNDPDPYDLPEEELTDAPAEDGEDALNDVNDPDPYDLPEEELTDAPAEDGEDALNDSGPYDLPEEELTDAPVEIGEDGLSDISAHDTDQLVEEEASDVSQGIPEEAEDITTTFPDERINESELNEFIDAAETEDLDSLKTLRDKIASGDIVVDPAESDDAATDLPKVLKRDETELYETGMRNIQDILDVKADDYRDKGYDEEQIQQMLAADKQELTDSFLADAFHDSQEVKPATDAAIPSDDGELPPKPIDAAEVENWLSDVNPNYDPNDIDSPYCNNCGSCAYAVNQRLEGNTDITATAENIGYDSEMEALTGMDMVSMSPDDIRDRLLAEGDGAHAIIGIDRAEGCGHWFNAACIDGKVVAIDGQSGEILDWPPDYGDVVNWEMSVKRRT